MQCTGSIFHPPGFSHVCSFTSVKFWLKWLNIAVTTHTELNIQHCKQHQKLMNWVFSPHSFGQIWNGPKLSLGDRVGRSSCSFCMDISPRQQLSLWPTHSICKEAQTDGIKQRIKAAPACQVHGATCVKHAAVHLLRWFCWEKGLITP